MSNQQPQLFLFGKGWVMRTTEERLQEMEAWENAQHPPILPIPTRVEDCTTAADVQLYNAIIPLMSDVALTADAISPTRLLAIIQQLTGQIDA